MMIPEQGKAVLRCLVTRCREMADSEANLARKILPGFNMHQLGLPSVALVNDQLVVIFDAHMRYDVGGYAAIVDRAQPRCLVVSPRASGTSNSPE